MLTNAQIAQVNCIRMPIRYALRIDGRPLSLSCIDAPSSVEEVTLIPHRSRGPNHRRLAATTTAGDVYGIDCVSNAFDYADINAVGVVRARTLFVREGVLEFEDGRFKSIPHLLEEAMRLREAARASWRTGISYVTELEQAEGLPGRLGLRRPQIGALHAIAAHWSLSEEPTIVVMPTGTGKTEVMVAVAVESKGNRILVVVPTDALREQTAGKFHEYGLLRRLGVVVNASNPVVGTRSVRLNCEQTQLVIVNGDSWCGRIGPQSA
jgi:hypothetical protein